MTLKLNGYSTAQFGKCHEVPVWQSSPMGPFDAWPSGGGGFETFYGFIGGENNQWDPALYDGTTPVEPPATPEEGYHLTEDLADRAISWVRTQKALMPDKPFFMYFAPGATHAPHHVPKEWADKYQGQFADGWDALREQTFARQKELGVIPADAELTERHDEIPAWDDMPEELKPVLERQMEVYAGFMEHTDHHVGRLIDAIEDLGVLERHDRLLHHRRQRRVRRRHAERRLQRDGQLQRHGRDRDARVHGEQDGRARLPQLLQPLRGRLGVGDGHAVPVDQAGRLALGWDPQRNHRALAQRDRGAGWTAHAVHARDRRGAHDPGGGRAAGADGRERRAAVADGRHQHAVHLQRGGRAGTARPPVLRDVRQPRHLPQGLERGHEAPDPVGHGRRHGARRSTTTSGSSTTAAATTARRTTSRPSNPEMLAKLQRLWLIEATKYNVLPMDDRTAERLEPTIAGRPTLDPRELPAVLPRDGPPFGEQRGQHQEQVVLRHR